MSVISAEAHFVYVHQLFMDTSRELHRVEQGWLYSFSHLRCASEEIGFCLLRIPVYWQQHLLWVFCKTFYMVNPTYLPCAVIFPLGVMTVPVSPAFYEAAVGGRIISLRVFDLRCLWRALTFKKTSSKIDIQNLRCSKARVCGNL